MCTVRVQIRIHTHQLPTVCLYEGLKRAKLRFGKSHSAGPLHAKGELEHWADTGCTEVLSLPWKQSQVTVTTQKTALGLTEKGVDVACYETDGNCGPWT